MQPRRVALCHVHFARSGGVEGYLHRLTEGLLERGWEVDVVCRKARSDLRHPRLRVHEIPVLRLSRSLRAWSFARRSHRRLVALDRERHYDAIHAFTKNAYYCDVFRDGGGCHLDYRAGYLDRFERGRWGRLWHRIAPYDRVLLRIERLRFGVDRGQIVYANSHWVREQIARRYDALPPERLRVLHNPVDLERFHPRRREAGRRALEKIAAQTPRAERWFVFVGHDYQRKGLAELLAGFARLEKDGGALCPWRLFVAGRERRPERFRAQAQTLGIGARLHWLGPRADVPDLLAGADVLALPTHFDAYPNVVPEAFASGTPALVSRETGAAELVEPGRTGWIVDRVEPESIAAALREALAPTDLEAFGRRARARAERCDEASHLAQVIAIYDEQARRRGRHGRGER
ncbi:MAG: glycosyltransferase family 1 protein [Planctomycetota bacterium]|nr:MAG: glycosyltransferase family 1 protein [Planctomycetota bacterium]